MVPFTLAVIAVWLLLFHLISTRTWGYGASTFVVMTGLGDSGSVRGVGQGAPSTWQGSAWYGLAGTLILVALVALLCRELLAVLAIDQVASASDIARNTLAAATISSRETTLTQNGHSFSRRWRAALVSR